MKLQTPQKQSIGESGKLPELTVIDGRVMVTSLAMAEDFEKLHKNVIRDIVEVVGNCPVEFGRLNFELSSHINEQNKTLPMYNLTRDGFMLVVMGFTGAKALAFKIAYLNEFNRLEKTLHEHQVGTAAEKPKLTDAVSTSPRLNDASEIWLRNVCLLSEEQIEHYTCALHCSLKNFKIDTLSESGNKTIQNNFLKGLTQLLLEEQDKREFSGNTSARNYLKLMSILTRQVEIEMAKVNRAVALIGEPGF